MIKIFIYYYPSILVYLFYLYKGFHWAKLDLIENLLFISFLFLSNLLISNIKIRNITSTVSLTIIYLIIGFEFIHALLYESRISQSSIYVLLETNTSEISEYLQTFFDLKLTLSLLVFFIPLSILPFIRKNQYNLSNVFNKRYFKLIIISILISSLIVVKKKYGYLVRYNSGYSIYKFYSNYQIEFNQLNKALYSKNIFLNTKKNNKEGNEINIIIIGEATNRGHMSLYGYNRQTNPKLLSQTKQLYIYDNVISPYPTTVPSLKNVLTLGNYESRKKVFKGSVVQLLNVVGYNTYWISNQNPVGNYDTFVTLIAKSTKKQIFINTELYLYNTPTPFDGELLPRVKQIIDEEKSNKKVLFIHLLGTHIDYRRRYPDEYNFFLPDMKQGLPSVPNHIFSKISDYEQKCIINSYDNAVVYNDYVVSEIIKMVEEKDVKSYVMYFSDHGEDVFETSKERLLSHNINGFTKPMYEIPFLLYLSDEYKIDKDFVFKKNRAYMTDDLIHSIADLMNISFEGYEEERSLFSRNFKKRKRLINGKIDYDSLYTKTSRIVK